MKKPSKPRPSSSSNAAPEAPACARLFFALWPPPAVVRTLTALARQAGEALGGKPTRPETLHLTLVFLGDFPVDRIPQLIAAAQGVKFHPFALSIDRVEAWAHNRLLWAGCHETPVVLQQLFEQLGEALLVAGIAHPEAGRRFVPHLTLVRKLARLPEPLGQFVMTPDLHWTVSRFALLSSRRNADGPAYETLAEFPANAG